MESLCGAWVYEIDGEFAERWYPKRDLNTLPLCKHCERRAA